MKILICGGRKYSDREYFFHKMDEILKGYPGKHTIIEGGARGADYLARNYAKYHGHELQTFEAPWEKHGRKAGYIRNQAMIEQNPDIVVAFPGGKGTANMVSLAKAVGVHTIEID